MALNRVILLLTALVLVNSKVFKKEYEIKETLDEGVKNIDDVFNGVYTECFTKFSYTCIQKKTLTYLKQLNDLSEVSLVGDYVKFGEFFFQYQACYRILKENNLYRDNERRYIYSIASFE